MTSDDRARARGIQLREALTRLFTDSTKIRMVAADAGLPVGRLPPDGAPDGRWFSIVEEAEKLGALAGLIERALRDYPRDAELLALRDGLPVDEAVLVVSAIDRYVGRSRAVEELDWVNLYEGDSAFTRRRLRDPSLWNTRLRGELDDVEKALRRRGATRVRVEGHMRLMSWFMVGATLPRTRQYTLSCLQGDAVWSSGVSHEPCVLREERVPVGAGSELAVAISVTNPAGGDVDAWSRAQGLPLAARVELSTEAVGKQAIRGGAHALGCADAIVNAVRVHVRETQATRVHLFAAAPQGVMLLVGHLWNALPPAQLYEHAPPGYLPCFTLG